MLFARLFGGRGGGLAFFRPPPSKNTHSPPSLSPSPRPRCRSGMRPGSRTFGQRRASFRRRLGRAVEEQGRGSVGVVTPVECVLCPLVASLHAWPPPCSPQNAHSTLPTTTTAGIATLQGQTAARCERRERVTNVHTKAAAAASLSLASPLEHTNHTLYPTPTCCGLLQSSSVSINLSLAATSASDAAPPAAAGSARGGGGGAAR